MLKDIFSSQELYYFRIGIIFLWRKILFNSQFCFVQQYVVIVSNISSEVWGFCVILDAIFWYFGAQLTNLIPLRGGNESNTDKGALVATLPINLTLNAYEGLLLLLIVGKWKHLKDMRKLLTIQNLYYWMGLIACISLYLFWGKVKALRV